MWCAVFLQKGNQLIQDDHYAADSIQKKMSELEKKWKELYRKMIERGDKLRQAGQQEQLMELLQVRRWWGAEGRASTGTCLLC